MLTVGVGRVVKSQLYALVPLLVTVAFNPLTG